MSTNTNCTRVLLQYIYRYVYLFISFSGDCGFHRASHQPGLAFSVSPGGVAVPRAECAGVRRDKGSAARTVRRFLYCIGLHFDWLAHLYAIGLSNH